MKRVFAHLVHWAPRILALLLLVFIGLFALDLFDSGFGAWQTLLSLLIHLIPSLAIAFVLTLAWRNSLLGAIGFFLLAVIFTLWILSPSDGAGYAVLSGPIVLYSLLFLADWLNARRTHAKP